MTRDNRLLQSQAFANAAWTKANITVADGTADVTAPDGSSTASRILETAANVSHTMQPAANVVTTSQGQTPIVHFWLKTGGTLSASRRVLVLWNNGTGADFQVFNPRTNLIDVSNGNVSGLIRSRGGWTECLCRQLVIPVGQEGPAANPIFELDSGADGAGISNVYLGVATAGIYIAWPQVTLGSPTCGFPEYIATGAAPAIGNPRFEVT